MRKGILAAASTWVKLEVMMTSEISQTQRTNSVGFPLLGCP